MPFFPILVLHSNQLNCLHIMSNGASTCIMIINPSVPSTASLLSRQMKINFPITDKTKPLIRKPLFCLFVLVGTVTNLMENRLMEQVPKEAHSVFSNPVDDNRGLCAGFGTRMNLLGMNCSLNEKTRHQFDLADFLYFNSFEPKTQ